MAVAPPPTVSGSLKANNHAPYVAPPFGGNNCSTLAAMGFNGYHGSTRPDAGAPPRGFTNVSTRPPPSSSFPSATADGINWAASQGAHGSGVHPNAFIGGAPATIAMPPAVSAGHVVLPTGLAPMPPQRAQAHSKLNTHLSAPGTAGAAPRGLLCSGCSHWCRCASSCGVTRATLLPAAAAAPPVDHGGALSCDREPARIACTRPSRRWAQDSLSAVGSLRDAQGGRQA